MGFTEIYGQKRAIALLKAGFKAGRNSHAYLFYGPPGVGKYKTAIVFAQLLNCPSPKEEAEPCGSCLSCRKISSGNHPDIMVVKPDGASLKIEQIRALQEKVYFKCYEGQFKVIMIDEAHLMTTEAANSLLKVLEEPPAETIFILLADAPDKLPVTIQSRCQPLSFAYLDEAVLKKILLEQGKEAPPSLALAQGSISKALEMVDNANYQEYWRQGQELFLAIKNGGYQEIFSWAEKLDKTKDRKHVDIILDYLLVRYRDKIVQLNLDSISGPELAGCFEAIEETNKAVYYLANKANCRLTLDVLFIKLKNIEQSERGVSPND